MKKLIGMACLLFLAACAATPPAAPPDSGLEGLVLIGPMCPVQREGQACPDQPYAARLTVNRPDGTRVTQVEADESGRFRVPLAPGNYLLHPESEGIEYAPEQPFTVRAGNFIFLTVHYDSGIR